MKLLFAVVCAGAIAFASGSVLAQGPGGGGFRGAPGGGGFGGGFGGGSDLFTLLSNESVQKEIELVPSQNEDIEDLSAKMRDGMQDMFRGMRGASEEERQEMFDKLRSSREDAEKGLAKILMPKQMERLKQIQVQQQARGRGGLSITNSEIAQELGLSQAEIAKLEAKAEQLQEEMRTKVAELRKQADDELVKMLTPEQQAKWKKMVGEPFEMVVERGGPGSFQGGQRGQGAPGGQRGQRGPRGARGGNNGDI